MLPFQYWHNEIKAGGNKAHVTAATLHAAEIAAHNAYDARVTEMTFSNRGVTPQGGNNEKMAITVLLTYAALGWDDLFKTTARDYGDKAINPSARYSPLSYAVQTITAILNQRSEPAILDHRTEPPRPLPYHIRLRLAPAA